MGVIRELSYDTVVKIAAGEVIDRPASVVRELLDNSIDAGAKTVAVHIGGGGKGYIEVSDDGSGMDRDDIALCYKNHATSKISAFSDIQELASLGFRGEALASIASVADLSILSRAEKSGTAWRVEIRQGGAPAVKEAARGAGTTVIAREIFASLPARKKFLSTDAAETKLVNREIIRKALAFPGVSFELTADGKRKYLFPARKTLLERLNDFYPDAVPHLLPVGAASGGVAVEGFASVPSFVRPNRSYEFFFANSRNVEWKNFFFALQDAYGSLIPRGYFPAVFIYARVPPADVDVNVHPMKKEVRFRDERAIAGLIRGAVHDALVRSAGPVEGPEGRTYFNSYEKKIGGAISEFMARHTNETDAGGGGTGLFPEMTAGPGAGPGDILGFRFAGVLFRTYIIMEGPDSAVFIDQHAAHERINYEKLKKHYREKVLDSVELLVPVTVDVPMEAVDGLSAGLGALEAMGFHVEHFGGNSFVIRSAPHYIDYRDAADCVMAYAGAVGGEAAGPADASIQTHASDFIDGAMKQMACKASVRAGDIVSAAEAGALLEEWLAAPDFQSCPHGRPAFFVMPKGEFERRFKRTGF